MNQWIDELRSQLWDAPHLAVDQIEVWEQLVLQVDIGPRNAVRRATNFSFEFFRATHQAVTARIRQQGKSK